MSLTTYSITGQQIRLEWDANSEPDIAGYNIYRAEASEGPFTVLNGSLIVNTNFIDTSLQHLVNYYYVATAVNTSNLESGYSNMVEYTFACKGDPNLDGQINVLDAVVISRHITGLNVLDRSAFLAADLNSSSNVDVIDLTLLHRHIAGLTVLEPCP